MVIKWVAVYFIKEGLPCGAGSLSILDKHYLQTPKWCIYQGVYTHSEV